MLNLLYHKRGEFSKRSPTCHVPTGALGRTSPLFTGLRASLSRSLQTLVGDRVVPLRRSLPKWLCRPGCVWASSINLSTGETEAEYLKCPGTC